MDFNRLLHDHQVALMNAGKPASIDAARNRAGDINHYRKLIETARAGLGVDSYPIFPGAALAPSEGL